MIRCWWAVGLAAVLVLNLSSAALAGSNSLILRFRVLKLGGPETAGEAAPGGGTGPGFHLVSVDPPHLSMDADPSSRIRLTFSEPIVQVAGNNPIGDPLAVSGYGNVRQAFISGSLALSLEPAINPTTLVIQPPETLIRGVTYQFNVPVDMIQNAEGDTVPGVEVMGFSQIQVQFEIAGGPHQHQPEDSFIFAPVTRPDFFARDVMGAGALALAGNRLAMVGQPFREMTPNPASTVEGSLTVLEDQGDGTWLTDPAMPGMDALPPTDPDMLAFANSLPPVFASFYSGTKYNYCSFFPDESDLHETEVAADFDDSGTVLAVSCDAATMASGAFRIMRRGAEWTGWGGMMSSTDLDPDAWESESASVEFGKDITISGNGQLVAVGAPGYLEDWFNGETYSEAAAQGAVTFLRWNGSSWDKDGAIYGSEASGKFGHAVDLSQDGTELIIGAPGENGTAGAVHVMTDGGSWSTAQVLSPPGLQAGDLFGTTLKRDGAWLVVGAPGGDGASTGDGVAYVYRKQAGTWSLNATLVGTDTNSGDRFGDGVAINGTRIAVGAKLYSVPVEITGMPVEDEAPPFSLKPLPISFSGPDPEAPAWLKEAGASPVDDTIDNEQGAVWVYDFDGTDWVRAPRPLAASDGRENSGFGRRNSIAIADDNTVHVGSYGALGIYGFTVP